MGDRKGVDLDRKGGEEELGGVEKGKTIIRILCEEKNLFAMKGKRRKKNEPQTVILPSGAQPGMEPC